MYDLKPCPFCGFPGEIKLQVVIFGASKYNSRCTNSDCKCDLGTFTTYDAAVEYWNFRHEPEVMAPVIERELEMFTHRIVDTFEMFQSIGAKRIALKMAIETVENALKFWDVGRKRYLKDLEKRKSPARPD